MEPCQYLFSSDHPHFEAVYLFLDGWPQEHWSQSVVLRRILFPLFSYPLMKMTDFITGGFLSSVLLHLIAGCAFIRFLSREYTVRTGQVAACLLPVFPGIAYFGAAPYSYACIVPFSLLGFMSLAALQRPNITSILPLCSGLFLGLLSVGYDLLPYFLPAGLLLLIQRRRWSALLIFACGCCFFPALTVVLLQKWFGVPPLNTNTASYINIIQAYGRILEGFGPAWIEMLWKLPEVFVHNFFYSMFVVLPAGAIFLFVRSFFRPVFHQNASVETCILLAGVAIWVFNNAAPPYNGWQMRGIWISRIYEPMFVPLLVFVCRNLTERFTKLDRIVLAVLVAIQSWAVYAPLLGVGALSDKLYFEFYRQSVPGAFSANLQTYGWRPFGFCSHAGVVPPH